MERQEHGAARAGRLTSSMAHDLMHGSLSTWNRLLADIRNPKPFYDLGPNTPEPLAWGLTHEARAAAMFWDRYPEYSIADPRFLRYHDPSDELRYKHLGTSPDRMLYLRSGDLVGPLEIKCPFVQEVHWRWIQAGALPAEYKAQCFFHMLVSGSPELWFVSFDPRMESEDHAMFSVHVRYSEDLGYVADMNAKLDRFLEVLDCGDTFVTPPTTADAVRSLFS